MCLEMDEKAHFWTNFLYINKGNIADLQNETFLSAKQTVSLKGIWKFSRKVLAPKAIEWMSGTTCRNVGQQGAPDSSAEDEHCSDVQWIHTISFKCLKFFSLFPNQLYIWQPTLVEERRLSKPCAGSLGMNNRTLCSFLLSLSTG